MGFPRPNDKRKVREGVNCSRQADCTFRKGGIRLVPNAVTGEVSNGSQS
jgi:hypothetical protein